MALIDLSNLEAEELGPPCNPPCDDEDCLPCAAAECPHAEPLHRHKDGCPSCCDFGQDEHTDYEEAVARISDTPIALLQSSFVLEWSDGARVMVRWNWTMDCFDVQRMIAELTTSIAERRKAQL